MSEESTQIFRGSDAPEITFTESRAAARPKPAAASPAEQRTPSDAKSGPADTWSLPEEAEDAGASHHRIDDVFGQLEPDLRQLHDTAALSPEPGEPSPASAPDDVSTAAAADEAQGPVEMRTWQDTSVAAPAGAVREDGTAMLPEPGATSDSAVMVPATGVQDQGLAGPVESRQLNDAPVPLPAAAALPPQEGVIPPGDAADNRSGPSDTRRLRDSVAAKPGANFQPDDESLPPAAAQPDERSGPAGPRALQDQRADALPATGGTAAAAPAQAEAAAAGAAGVISDPDLTFKPHDATPWALSIHLQERIASLGVSTARVGHQLDALEESIKRLGKRIKK